MTSPLNPITTMLRPELARLCLLYGPILQADLRNVSDELGGIVDGSKLLWAMSGRESSFGKNLGPRFEPAYYIGGSLYAHSAELQHGVSVYGRDFSCSYGPLQVMAVNARGFKLEEIAGSPEKALQAAVARLRVEVLQRQRAATISQICDSWNTGNFRDHIVPLDYIKEVRHHYVTEVIG
jgi:hypothetical protein